MPKFGNTSMRNLETAHPDLQELFKKVVEQYDCSILEGHRDEATQNELFEAGRSKLQWPKSKHNKLPAQAVDVAPYPIDWDDHRRFYMLAGYVFGIARTMGIKIRWGGAWSGGFKLNDTDGFNDLVHWELVD